MSFHLQLLFNFNSSSKWKSSLKPFLLKISTQNKITSKYMYMFSVWYVFPHFHDILHFPDPIFPKVFWLFIDAKQNTPYSHIIPKCAMYNGWLSRKDSHRKCVLHAVEPKRFSGRKLVFEDMYLQLSVACVVAKQHKQCSMSWWEAHVRQHAKILLPLFPVPSSTPATLFTSLKENEGKIHHVMNLLTIRKDFDSNGKYDPTIWTHLG